MKTTLDKHDQNVIFLAKGWFREKQNESNLNKIDALKRIFGKCYALDPGHVRSSDILRYILSNIIRPFVIPNIGDSVFDDLFLDAAPSECWKVGYDQGNKGLFAPLTPVNPEYNYVHAMIYNCMSKICCSEVKYFPGLDKKNLDLSLIN